MTTSPLEALIPLVEKHGLKLVEDCAQSIGATWEGRGTGSVGHIGCYSFYPTKNLGADGDGGMCVTQDDGLARRLRMLRVHGIEKRYYHDLHGVNSRLDELQAAFDRGDLQPPRDPRNATCGVDVRTGQFVCQLSDARRDGTVTAQREIFV